MSAERLQVALVYGGRSGEHEVSLRSAASVAEALSAFHDVLPVLIDRHGQWFLQPGRIPEQRGGTPVFLAGQPAERGRLRRLADATVAGTPDVYFPVLHGTHGEDGTIQGLFELAGVAYVGAGVAASAAAMDKELMKALFAQAGIPEGPYRVLHARDARQESAVLEALGLPVFVKPANLGSSVAVTKVKTARELGAALDAAFEYDEKVVVEAAIECRELEISILGNESPRASLPGEILPDREFYDYDSKYSADSRTELVVPARLPDAIVREAQELGVRAFRAVGACGYARVDFFLEKASGRLLVNEINTIPGFTSISMFPKMWQAAGISFGELVTQLVSLGVARHASRLRLRTDYR
jgi:D-alanine-D-alanine ligase